MERARELGAVHAEAVALDVREPRTVEDAVRRVTDGAGRLDGLVTSAGIVADGWLAVALAPVTQAGNARTSPTAARSDLGPQRAVRR